MTIVLSERYLLTPHCELFVAILLSLLLLGVRALDAKLMGFMAPILPTGPVDVLLPPGRRLARGSV
jgi:hypothetical protein